MESHKIHVPNHQADMGFPHLVPCLQHNQGTPWHLDLFQGDTWQSEAPEVGRKNGWIDLAKFTW